MASVLLAIGPLAFSAMFQNTKTTDQAIISTKQRRVDLDNMIQSMKELPSSREVSIAITKTQEAIMWLGMNLKAINEATPGASPNPYPNSRDVTNTKIEPTADNLKL